MKEKVEKTKEISRKSANDLKSLQDALDQEEKIRKVIKLVSEYSIIILYLELRCSFGKKIWKNGGVEKTQ